MKKGFFLALILILSLNVSSKNSTHFNNISTRDGLSNIAVNCMLMDKHGFMWFGTYDGLDRYDGISFYNYSSANNKNSLIGNTINCLLEDNDGNLLVGGDKGVSRYKWNSDSFEQIFSCENVQCFLKSNDSGIYFACNGGVYRMNEGVEPVKVADISILQKSNLGIDIIMDMKAYDDDNILILLKNSGIKKFNTRTFEVSNFINSDTFLNKLLVSKKGNVFVGTNNMGILIYSNKGNLKKHIRFADRISAGRINFIRDVEQIEDDIWVATDGGGIVVIDENGGIKEVIRHDDSNKLSISSNFINTFYYKDDIIWIGTVKNGVSYTNNRSDFYTYTKNASNLGLSLSDIISLKFDRNHTLWIGTDGKGLNYMNKDGSIGKCINSDLSITSIDELNNQKLLCGTYQNGLKIYNKAENRFINYKLDEKTVWCVKRTSKNEIYLGGDNIYKMNNIMEIVKSFKLNNYLHHITAIHKYDNKIYFGGNNSLFVLNPLTDSLTNIELSCGWIYDIVTDREGGLILATDNGITGINTDDNSVNHENYRYLNSSMKLYSVIYDYNNILWASTSSGLIKIDNTQNSASTYDYRDGFIDNYFRRAAKAINRQGVLYFGGLNGLLRFNPDDINKQNSNAEVVFTDFKINTTNSVHDVLSQNHINNLKKVILKYNQSHFTVKFVSPNYFQGNSNKYYYILEGFNNEWSQSNGRQLTFNLLNPGTYKLKLKSESPKIDSSSNIKELEIVVLSPWWNSYWFYLLTLILIAILCYVIFLILMKRKQFKLDIQNERLMHKRQKELDEQRFSFFTNISHELRTPLSLIISPIEAIRRNTASSCNQMQEFDIIYENAGRLKKLVDSVLDFRKMEFSMHDLKASRKDIVSFTKTYIEQFTLLARNKNLSIQFNYSESEINIWFDSYKMEIILCNLLSNATKYSQDNGKIDVSIETTDDNVCLSVKDTGVGVKDDEIDKIFDRFYQSEGTIGGSGVGLSITKRFVELHSATISVESEIDKGTIFTIRFLKGEKHLTKKQKVVVKDDVIEEPKMMNESSVTLEPLSVASMKNTILIVEDEHSLRDYLAKALLPYFNIELAKNGKEALNLMNSKSINIVISDIMMPEMDGLELCYNVKNNIEISHIPLVLLTAKAQSDNISEGYKTGADAYVTKPFDIEVVINILLNLIKNRDILKQKFLKDLNVNAEDITHSYSDDEFMKQTLDVIDQNISNPNFDVSYFIEHMNYGRTVCYKKVKEITGLGIGDFITSIRLKKSAALLIHTNKTVSEIASDVGFNNAQYFSTIFKKNFNSTPSQYRKRKVS